MPASSAETVTKNKTNLWMRLAKMREKDHPADAVAVYRRQIDPLVSRKDNTACREDWTVRKRPPTSAIGTSS